MDHELTRPVQTFKSGKFVFSALHDEAALAPRLIELDVMQRMLATLPVLPAIHAKFKGELVRKSIHGTAAIEGNPLNEDDVARILEQGDDFVPVNDREREIANLGRAYERFASMPKTDAPLALDEYQIREMHALITDGLAVRDNIPGQYRNIRVEVGDDEHGGKYTPPRILEDIKTLMREFVAWMNSAPIMRLHPLVRAALAHYHLGLIHPFRDGNGRTARLLEAMMISASGIKHTGKMLSNYYYTHLDEYYIAFRRCETDQEKSVYAFLDFFMSGTKDRLDHLHDMISTSIRILATQEYIHDLRRWKHLSQRQHDLAMILFSLGAGIKANDLYSSPLLLPLYRNTSEQTARRDIKKLLEWRILTKVANTFFLNTHIMDY